MTDDKLQNVILNRMDQFETKLDRINEALVTLARTEQKIVSINDQTDSLRRELDQVETRLSVLERWKFKFIGGFTVVGAAIGYLATPIIKMFFDGGH